MAYNPYQFPFPTFHPQQGAQYKSFEPGFNQFIQNPAYAPITRGLGGSVNGRRPHDFPNGIMLFNIYQSNGYPY